MNIEESDIDNFLKLIPSQEEEKLEILNEQSDNYLD